MNARLRSQAATAAVSSCIVVLTAFYYIFPEQRLIFVAIGATGVVGILLGIRLNRPAHRLPWLLLAAGNFAFAAGQAAQIILIQLPDEEVPFPSIADGFYLAAYPLYAAGLLGFVHWRTSWRDRASLVDALTLTVGLALLSWLFLIDPYARAEGLTWVQKAFSIAYPLGDILVLAMLLRLLVGHGGKSRSLMLLTVGTIGLLAADVAYGLIQLNGTWRTGTAVDLGWAVLYGAWAAAALDPSMRSLTQPVAWRADTGTGTGRLSLLTLASLIAPAILLTEAVRGVRSEVGVIGVFSAVLFLLVLYRLAGVVATHRRAVGREKILRNAVSSLGGAGDPPDVAAAVHSAATELMSYSPPRSALLTVPDNSLWLNGVHGDVRGPLSAPVTAAVQELIASGENRLVTLDGVGPDLAAHLTGEEEGPIPSGPALHALVCPLRSQDHPSGDPLIGALIVAGDERDLLVLRETLATLAAQAALAVARIALAQEVNRRNSEMYFRTLVQNASDVILILDGDQVRYASPSADQLLGHAHLEGTHLVDLVPPQDSRAVAETLGRIGSHEYQIRREHWRMVRADRATIEVEVRWSDLRDEATVGGVVLTLRDVTEQRKLERELTHQAFHDPLTGLANRLLFQERVNHALVQAQRDGTIVGVLFVDVDDFKVVNDMHGHGVGDELLVALSLRLQTTVRASDTAARIGGDEFALLVEGSATPTGVERFTEHVMTAFADPFRLSVGPLSTYASIGVATTEDSIDSVELLTHADLALYAAKTAGKRQWRRYHPELQSGMAERAKLQEGLDSSSIETSFMVLYQPIVELASGRIAGFEALVRWPHSARGMVLPEQFITLAEESGQIVPLGAWVLDQAASEAVRWEECVLHGGRSDRNTPYVSVNVSPRQFRDEEFHNVIRRALDLSAIEPSNLVLELTENVLMYNDERILAEMSSLTDLGIRIAIDDFGTGYSSLSYLREFPISILKIDKSFIDGLGRSPEQYALVEGITHLADTLGLTVIAEGVEDARQQESLISMGCRFGQGYLFAEPVSAEAAEHLVLAPPLGRLAGFRGTPAKGKP
ncbi:putative bifunctional diguanylate cyclase/phosphodiesterase [Streptomyces neyagawaensis]|uniref:putative bifunctional diguanylate cyclase/phosphodiesterase n=1 Tax=Streptomyces neyagawaensis TaxID=42238 RepID=UPI0006E2813A|nr:EAL domain-containing protein [Streptomyces neyagawaensis]MCL6738319.1 EAL domain-containing protein [Streptomyces neyagawaensis]MDE1688172.1 EAL domain-containing protein [Streptomyces neyagawaensis]